MLLICVSTAAAYTTQNSAEAGDNGGVFSRLRWKTSIIKIAFSNSLLKPNGINVKPGSDVQSAIQRSLDAWERAADIKFQVVWTDKQSVSPSGNSGDGVSLVTIAQSTENLLLFAEDFDEVSARTRTFYNRRGLITEADIVFNPYQQFSTDGTIGTFDFEATLTHEIGHLLGLEHSFVMGATMHAHQGKNGVYNLANLSSRTLAEDDIAAVRSLYGAKPESENCCGTLYGKLLLANGKAAKDFQVWAEEIASGRTMAGVLTDADGSFHLEGLQSGKYKVYSRRATENAEKSFSVEKLGEIEIQSQRAVGITKKLQQSSKAIDLRYVGFNGQLSDLAVSLNGGKSYTVYIGGKNFNPENLKITFNSPYISVAPDSFIKYNYDFDVSVVSFEVRVKNKVFFGEYGIFVETGDGRIYCLNGGITIENFENPWNNGLLIENNL